MPMGLVVFANPAAEAIFGRSVETLLGSPIGIPLFASEALEIAIHQPDGDPVEAEVRVVDTIWDHRPARLASLRDVSARRAIEERLRHSAKMEASDGSRRALRMISTISSPWCLATSRARSGDRLLATPH